MGMRNKGEKGKEGKLLLEVTLLKRHKNLKFLTDKLCFLYLKMLAQCLLSVILMRIMKSCLFFVRYLHSWTVPKIFPLTLVWSARLWHLLQYILEVFCSLCAMSSYIYFTKDRKLLRFVLIFILDFSICLSNGLDWFLNSVNGQIPFAVLEEIFMFTSCS